MEGRHCYAGSATTVTSDATFSWWYSDGKGSTCIPNMCFLILRGRARSWYDACCLVGTLKTWSRSSSDSALVSGTKMRTRTQPITLNRRIVTSKKQKEMHSTHFHAAYHPNAPCGLNELIMAGKVIEITKLKNQQVAVANDIPISRTLSGNDSAEYWYVI